MLHTRERLGDWMGGRSRTQYSIAGHNSEKRREGTTVGGKKPTNLVPAAAKWTTHYGSSRTNRSQNEMKKNVGEEKVTNSSARNRMACEKGNGRKNKQV